MYGQEVKYERIRNPVEVIGILFRVDKISVVDCLNRPIVLTRDLNGILVTLIRSLARFISQQTLVFRF